MAGGDKAPGAGGRPGFGVGCDKAVRTDPYSDIHIYPQDGGPVVLRAGETGRPQLYCTGTARRSGLSRGLGLFAVRSGGPADGGNVGKAPGAVSFPPGQLSHTRIQSSKE